MDQLKLNRASSSQFPTSLIGVPRRNVRDGLVSIVMRTKDRPLLLARAISSVLNQSYSNWHIHLVNDGGDKASLEKLLSQLYSALAGRITCHHHDQSLGMEAASNTALLHVQGDYVIVHDDDDSWSPLFLEATVRFLEDKENNHLAAVATNCLVYTEQIINDEVEILSINDYPLWKGSVDVLDVLRRNIFPPICLLMRRQAVEIVGPYNSELPVLGDWDYLMRILAVGDVGTIDKQLAHHHLRPTSSAEYGNSIIDGMDKHIRFQTLYRNSLYRSSIQANPSSIGLLHVLLSAIDRVEDQVKTMSSLINEHSHQVGSLSTMHHDALVAELASKFRKVDKQQKQIRADLGLVRVLWRLLLPLRRLRRLANRRRRTHERIRS